MADTPSPPRAKGIAGIFKNKPAWVWVMGVTVLVGVAYLAWSRSNTPADTTGGDAVDPGPVGPAEDAYYDGTGGQPMYATPGASQGAYGGYDYPSNPVQAPLIDGAGAPETPQPSFYIIQPGPTGDNVSADEGIAPTVGTSGAAVTGGGHPRRDVAAHRNHQAGNPRRGRRYITTTRHGHTVHLYESHPGSGDFGKHKSDRITLAKKKPHGVHHKKKPAHKKPHHHHHH